MSTVTMLIIVLISMLVLLSLLVSLILRVKRLEDKIADVSATDVAAYVENMREILIESERVADQLDASIKEKEALLEDLSDLVEARINKLQQLTGYESIIEPLVQPNRIAPEPRERSSYGATPLQNKVYQMLLGGDSVASIATKMGLTVDEVEMLIDLVDDN